MPSIFIEPKKCYFFSYGNILVSENAPFFNDTNVFSRDSCRSVEKSNVSFWCKGAKNEELSSGRHSQNLRVVSFRCVSTWNISSYARTPCLLRIHKRIMFSEWYKASDDASSLGDPILLLEKYSIDLSYLAPHKCWQTRAISPGQDDLDALGKSLANPILGDLMLSSDEDLAIFAIFSDLHCGLSQLYALSLAGPWRLMGLVIPCLKWEKSNI